jgi:hypothetical protein
MLKKVETFNDYNGDVNHLKSEVEYRTRLQKIGNKINAAKKPG